ncbi:MAG: PGF-pre-PGF domain-containing protein [Methanococcoides sp.]|nr:PGF-pre-PGF domain-containing protein [Methanococcoides sp.]
MEARSRTRPHGKYISVGITIAVLIMMILSGPVSAVTIGITGLDGTTPTKGESISFNVTATIENTDRYVPIDNFSLDITGATSKEVVFSTEGNVLSGDTGITIAAVTVPSSAEYGHGDGYGYDSSVGYGYDFGDGYGYGYSYGAGGEDVEYKYTITLDTSILNTGAYEAVLSLNTGNSAKPSFESSSASFVINTPKTSGGSSGGGGGGSGATGETFENIAFKDVKTENILGGLEISYTFDEERNAIEYINLSALRNYGRVSATVEVLNDDSSMVDESAPGIVYSNLNIWVGKSGFATEDNIADLVIGFSVAKDWFTENGIDDNSIVLYRHSGGNWNALNTMKVGEDDSYIYFEAKTPGFSPFAITGETNSVVSEDEWLTATDTNTSTEESEGRMTLYKGLNRTKSADPKTSTEHRIMLLSFATIIGLLAYINRGDISKYLKKK